MRADRGGHQRFRAARNLAHRGMPFEHEAILALHQQRNLGPLDGIERKVPVEQPHERPQRARRIIVLGLAQQQRRATLDVAQIDVIAQRGADDLALAGHHQSHFGLRVVPARARMQPHFSAEPHRTHRLALGEDLRIRANAHFQVLAPHPARDQRLLDLHRRVRTRHQLRQFRADQLEDFPAQGIGPGLVAARLLLDHALQQRHHKGHARRLDRLQIHRCQQARDRRIVPAGDRIGHDRLDRAQIGARSAGHMAGRPPAFGDIAHRRHALGRNIDHRAVAHRHDARARVARHLGATQQDTRRNLQIVHWLLPANRP